MTGWAGTHHHNNTETPPRHGDNATPTHSRVQAGGTEAKLRHLPLLTTVVKPRNITLLVWCLTLNNYTAATALFACKLTVVEGWLVTA